MKKYKFLDNDYELIEDYKNGFDNAEVQNKFTDYFIIYDYVVGDWAYGKLRLKGFCDETNKNFKEINNIKNKNNYIKNNCAYDCRYFVLKKIKNV